MRSQAILLASLLPVHVRIPAAAAIGVVAVVLTLFLMPGPGRPDAAGTPPSAPRLHLLTTVPVLYCFTVNVAGDRAIVENLLPPGAAVHDFQFTVAARRKLEHADLIVANGLGLESWLERALQQSSHSNILRCAEGFDSSLIFSNGAFANPHVWLDPRMAAGMVTNILRALSRADPSNAVFYAANAADFNRRLLELDAVMFAGLQPVIHRSIATFHDAYPYLARRYDLSIAGVVEERPEVDPSPAHLTRLRAIIQHEQVRALFVDPQEGVRRARQLGRDFGISVHLLDTLEAAPLSASAYEDGMKRNLESLQKALR
ncbi:MAG: zinc transport system substrate-binding protein [Verrucomicrobiota bacterium]